MKKPENLEIHKEIEDPVQNAREARSSGYTQRDVQARESGQCQK